MSRVLISITVICNDVFYMSAGTWASRYFACQQWWPIYFWADLWTWYCLGHLGLSAEWATSRPNQLIKLLSLRTMMVKMQQSRASTLLQFHHRCLQWHCTHHLVGSGCGSSPETPRYPRHHQDSNELVITADIDSICRLATSRQVQQQDHRSLWIDTWGQWSLASWISTSCDQSLLVVKSRPQYESILQSGEFSNCRTA